MNPRLRSRPPQGFTLMEMLTASVIIAISMSAAASLGTTLKMQEELSWRGTVTNNYLETSCRLWQLGQTPSDIAALMPGTAGNRPLNECLDSSVSATTIASSDKDGLGVLEGLTATVQLGSYSGASTGAITSFNVYRPTTRGANSP